MIIRLSCQCHSYYHTKESPFSVPSTLGYHGTINDVDIDLNGSTQKESVLKCHQERVIQVGTYNQIRDPTQYLHGWVVSRMSNKERRVGSKLQITQVQQVQVCVHMHSITSYSINHQMSKLTSNIMLSELLYKQNQRYERYEGGLGEKSYE